MLVAIKLQIRTFSAPLVLLQALRLLGRSSLAARFSPRRPPPSPRRQWGTARSLWSLRQTAAGGSACMARRLQVRGTAPGRRAAGTPGHAAWQLFCSILVKHAVPLMLLMQGPCCSGVWRAGHPSARTGHQPAAAQCRPPAGVLCGHAASWQAGDGERVHSRGSWRSSRRRRRGIWCGRDLASAGSTCRHGALVPASARRCL